MLLLYSTPSKLYLMLRYPSDTLPISIKFPRLSLLTFSLFKFQENIQSLSFNYCTTRSP